MEDMKVTAAGYDFPYYAGADLVDPMKPGLTRIDDAPYPGASSLPEAERRQRLGFDVAGLVALIRSLLRVV
jgi:hypothetical protein